MSFDELSEHVIVFNLSVELLSFNKSSGIIFVFICLRLRCLLLACVLIVVRRIVTSSHRLRFQLFCISAVVCQFIVYPIVVFRTVVLRTVGSFSFSLFVFVFVFAFSPFQLINHWNLITENWVCASRFRISFQI